MYKIKNYLLMLAALFTIIIAACSNSSSEPTEPELSVPADLLSNGLNFQMQEGEQNFSIKANIKPEVSSEKSWCKILSVESTADTYKCTVSVEENTETRIRTSLITVKAGGITKTFEVKQQAKTTPPSTDENEAQAFTKSLGLGWNLGNQLDASNNEVANETAWGNPVATQATFNKLAEAGINSVRIPITWLGKVGKAPEYAIDKQWLDRVAECVGYAEKAGLKAIINIHHDGSESKYWLDIKNAAKNETVNQKVKAQLQAMWKQIAERFKDKGEFLMFESMNEIHDGSWGWGDNLKDGGKQYAVLNEWNQLFVDAVRNVGGENSRRYLGIPGYCTNPDLTISTLILPRDPANRLMVSVHYYDPFKYAIADEFSEWGHTGAAGKKDPNVNEEQVKKTFGNLKTAFIDKGIPVYIGEMGAVHRDNARAETFRKYYMEYVFKAARTYGLAPFYWDNGSKGTGNECFGIIDHGTGNFINNGQEIIETMKKAVSSEDASYTLETVYNNAPK